MTMTLRTLGVPRPLQPQREGAGARLHAPGRLDVEERRGWAPLTHPATRGYATPDSPVSDQHDDRRHVLPEGQEPGPPILAPPHHQVDQGRPVRGPEPRPGVNRAAPGAGRRE